MNFELRYRPSHAPIEALQLGECTIHRTANGKGVRWWLLWFYVARETDGVPEDFAVPVAPGAYSEQGPGGRTWGLTKSAGGIWQISPSINVMNDGGSKAIHPGPHATLSSLWHQTPTIVGVPDDEKWIAGAP